MAKLREALAAKTKEAKNLEGKSVEQYAEGFDEAINQVKVLYSDFDVSSYCYSRRSATGSCWISPSPMPMLLRLK